MHPVHIFAAFALSASQFVTASIPSEAIASINLPKRIFIPKVPHTNDDPFFSNPAPDSDPNPAEPNSLDPYVSDPDSNPTEPKSNDGAGLSLSDPATPQASVTNPPTLSTTAHLDAGLDPAAASATSSATDDPYNVPIVPDAGACPGGGASTCQTTSTSTSFSTNTTSTRAIVGSTNVAGQQIMNKGKTQYSLSVVCLFALPTVMVLFAMA